MPSQRLIRIVGAIVVLVGVLSIALADWSGGSGGSYVVRPGDSLWSIAASRGLTVTQLAAANGMEQNDILLIGRHLVIPSPGGAVRSVNGTLTGSATSGPAAANASTFCASFQSTPGPIGVLPSRLAGTSAYYQLRPLFERWATYYGVSLALLEAVAWQESGWQQNVVSVTGAVGVGQIEPYTATFIEQQLIGQPLEPATSVSDNIRMSAAFLAYLAHREGNNRCATIAAYYEGPLNLQTLGVLADAQQYVANVEALEARFE